MPKSIWWIRRDLRLHDNPALHRALELGDVTPVFILDPAALDSRYHRNAERRRAFLFDGLRALDADLRARGSRLIVRRGDPRQQLGQLLKETGAETVIAAEDYSPYARRRDEAVASAMNLELTGGIAIRRPQEVLKADREPFKVFTPFSRAWLQQPSLSRANLLATPRELPAVSSAIESVEIPPSDVALATLNAGEAAAHERLKRFVAGAIAGYAEGRNRLDEDGTSVLSPYLRFGMISPRECAIAAIEAQAAASESDEKRGAAVWLNELIWRDFYLAVLSHFPAVMTREFDASLRDIPWRNDPAEIEAWQQGRTGYPVVDAAMRQLAETGWMHNRARMIVASFLVKHLLVDWRIGEQWFMDQLIDGDPAANNGGWQWTAGVGTDAAPYFRVFNPVLQAKRFDPDGAYVRRWLPALLDVDQRFVHEPWRLPSTQHSALDYPEPIVDLAEGRQRALDAYNAAKRR